VKIQKADVLTHPEKVNRLLGASCGEKKDVPESPQLVKFFSEMVNKSVNHIPIAKQDVKILLSIPVG
jgi:hypothetical protein